MSKAYGYVRVSTDKQENSVEAQSAQIEKYWHGRRPDLEGAELSGLCIDVGTSGDVPMFKRPNGRQMAALRRGDHIILTKIDRGFRNTADALHCLETWEKAGIELHLLEYNVDTTTAIGYFIFTVICGVATFEIGRKAERIREINHDRNRQGRPNATGGNVAVGWMIAPGCKFSDPWVEDVEIRELAKEASELYIAGMTWEEIYISWRKLGRRRKNGKEWLPETISRLAKSYHDGFPQLSKKAQAIYDQAKANGGVA